MGVVMIGRYLGNKKMLLSHPDSGVEIQTAAPKDNNGDGSSFSPTDLFTTSLGACMMTIMGILAERDGISLEGSHYLIEKIMNQTPRRVGKIVCDMHLPKSLTKESREKLERGAATCPVHHSMHPDIEVNVNYHYDI